jgi:hypothetical protein
MMPGRKEKEKGRKYCRPAPHARGKYADEGLAVFLPLSLAQYTHASSHARKHGFKVGRLYPPQSLPTPCYRRSGCCYANTAAADLTLRFPFPFYGPSRAPTTRPTARPNKPNWPSSSLVPLPALLSRFFCIAVRKRRDADSRVFEGWVVMMTGWDLRDVISEARL